MPTVVRARAKINWALDVLSRREDGLHELDMLMQTVELCDALTFTQADGISFSCDSLAAGDDRDNLIVRAANALNAYAGTQYGIRIALEKRIPVQAGLGGGSADCASTLITLNDLWALHLSMETLCAIGRTLGSDVPYMLKGGLARVRGTGERIEPLSIARAFDLLIVMPDTGLSTGRVFGDWDKVARQAPIDMHGAQAALIDGDLDALRATADNALERVAIALVPEIDTIRSRLYNAGARYARMSGSGSAMFGVFDTEADAKNAGRELPYASFVTRTVCE